MSTMKRIVAAALLAGVVAALAGCFPPPPGALVPDVPAPYVPEPHVPAPHIPPPY